MALSLRTNPEDVYSEVSTRADVYAGMSLSLAERGDAYGATLALVASDVCHMQGLLWQSVLVVSPDQDGQYASVLGTMDAALRAWAATGDDSGQDATDLSCADVIAGARRAVEEAFDPSVWEMLAPRLADTSHLAHLPVVQDTLVADRREQMLGGLAPIEAAKAKLTESRDTASVAAVMREAGRDSDAVTAAYQSDIAAFEAHLIAEAVLFDDATLASAEVVWLLGCEAVSRVRSLPADVTQARTVVRRALRSAVGLLDADNLTALMAEPGQS